MASTSGFGRDLGGFSSSSTAAGRRTAGTKKKTIADFLSEPQKRNVRALGADRTKEIVTNLNMGFASDPSKFSDVRTFRNAYGYRTADAGKRDLLDARVRTYAPNMSAQPKNDAVNAAVAATQPGRTPPSPTVEPNARQRPVSGAPATGLASLNPDLLKVDRVRTPRYASTGPTKQVTATPVSYVKTGAANYDTAARRSASQTNRFTRNFVANTNRQNAWLDRIARAERKRTERTSETYANRTERRKRLAARIAARSENERKLRYEQELANNKARLAEAEKTARKNLATARLMASLTWGTGGSTESANVIRVRDNGMALIASIKAKADAIGSAYASDITKIKNRFLENNLKIDTSYNENIKNARDKLASTMIRIETTKGKNTREALTEMRNAIKDHSNTVISLTKAANDRKLAEIKVAREKAERRYKVSRDRRKKDAELSADLSSIDTYVASIARGTVSAATVPATIRSKVLEKYNERFPQEERMKAFNLVMLIPGIDRRSDQDFARQMDRTINLLRAGLTPDVIALKLKGVSDNAPLKFSRTAFATLTPENMESVKRALNNGLPEIAAKRMETYALSQVGRKPENIATVRQRLKLATRTAQLLHKMKTDGTYGNLSAPNRTIGRLMAKYTSNPTDPAARDVLLLGRLIERMNAREKRMMFGTSQTAWEQSAAENIFPSSLSSWDAISLALGSFVDNKVRRMNGARMRANLPEIVPVYENGEKFGSAVDSIRNTAGIASFVYDAMLNPMSMYESRMDKTIAQASNPRKRTTKIDTIKNYRE